jgi:hypothetical protein
LGSTPIQIHSLEDPAWKHVLTARKQLSSLNVRVTAAAITDGWEHAALKRHQMNDDVEPILHEVEAGQRPEEKDITDHSHLQDFPLEQGEVLGKLHGGSSEGYLGANKTFGKARLCTTGYT